MQDRETTFERAVNSRNLGAMGDPERWGGTAELLIDAPNRLSNQTVYSPQIIRAQCEDLIARAWETLVFWTLEGVDFSDGVALTLETTIGAGQVTGIGEVLIYPPNPIAAAVSPWFNDATHGTIQIPQCLPACAIAARARLNVVTDGSAPAHTVRATCRVLVAPRSLI